jgi:hypothetical protein
MSYIVFLQLYYNITFYSVGIYKHRHTRAKANVTIMPHSCVDSVLKFELQKLFFSFSSVKIRSIISQALILNFKHSRKIMGKLGLSHKY